MTIHRETNNPELNLFFNLFDLDSTKKEIN